jgi:hypothetical protein
MGTGLLMYCNNVGAGIGKGINIAFGLGNHQMNVKQQFRVRPQGFDNAGTNCQVGHEMAVHYIDMDQVGSGPVKGSDLFSQTTEIG